MGGKDNNNTNNGQPDNSGNRLVIQPMEALSTDEGFDIGYHGSIEIGRQTFTVISDTGSSDLWMPSQACVDAACKAHKSYDPKEQSDNKLFKLNMVLVKFLVLLPWMMSQSMDEAYGILRMALDQLSTQNLKASFTQFVAKNAVKDSVFCFFLERQKDGSNSQLTLGG
ncbi:10905_t:CDS:2, partial [Ambispora leptoticha]